MNEVNRQALKGAPITISIVGGIGYSIYVGSIRTVTEATVIGLIAVGDLLLLWLISSGFGALLEYYWPKIRKRINREPQETSHASLSSEPRSHYSRRLGGRGQEARR